MANIVVVGAGLSGTLAAYETAAKVGPGHTVTLIGEHDRYHFVPSNPWVAVGWRKRSQIEVDLTRSMARRKIRFLSLGAKRLHPDENRVELSDGNSLVYDYLIIATGPELAFDEIPGLGPHAFTQSICEIDHAEQAALTFEPFAAKPGPAVVGATQGASCFGPAYEYALVLDTELKRRRIRNQVPMTFITPEPYLGHLGLDGVGDTRGQLESLLRHHHIKWITSARVKNIEREAMTVEEVAEDGSIRKTHELPFAYAMLLPPFRGVPAISNIEGLTNPRGFVIVDKYQRNPRYLNIFAVGVTVAIPPMASYSVPVGVPKTGFMIESMVAATAINIDALIRGRQPHAEGTWNAICLADFGSGGIVFVAEPQIPPRNFNWSATGHWVHWAKVAFEKFFLRKIRTGKSEPLIERWFLKLIGIQKLIRVKEN